MYMLLFPFGVTTGQQVRPVFERSGLPSPQLAQIWSSVDQNNDGFININEFVMAMNLIRQAQASTTSSLSAMNVSHTHSLTHSLIYMYAIQDDLLARVIFGEFVCGKLIGKFFIGDFVPRAIEHVQIEIKMTDFILAISTCT